METNMNLDEMRKLVEAEDRARAEAAKANEVAQVEVANAEVVTPSEDVATVKITENAAVYDGPGLVVENKIETEKKIPDPNDYGVVSPQTLSHIEKYMAEMDEDIEKAKAMKEEAELNDTYSEAYEDEKEFTEKYNTAVDVIVKTGVGTVLDFTPEERAKLERAKTIKLEEIETVEIKTLKTKRLKKPSELNKIIKRSNDSRTTQVVLPLSGYTATMKGCSAYELMGLIDTKGNPVTDTQNKWSVIHSKIETTSIGKMDFNTFLRNTASSDYNNLVYGVLCATYPDDDKIPVTCPDEKCNMQYDHHYSIRSLIRAEEMSDRLRDTFMKIADASIDVETARKCHDEALVNTVKAIVLPVCGYTIEIYVQTAYDLINRSIKGLSKDKDSKFAEAAVLSTMVNRILIPDEEEPDVPYEIDAAMEISEIIYGLSDIDLNVLRTVADDLFGDMIVGFGLMSVKCPTCGHFTPTIPMDLEQLLFYKYRQAMSMTIE